MPVQRDSTGIWRAPEVLVTIGFARSRVVILNEAHHGLLQCVRTREVGRRCSLPRGSDAYIFPFENTLE
jgi:hypothetical protein